MIFRRKTGKRGLDFEPSLEPHQTAMLIAKVQDICRRKNYSPAQTLSLCVVGGITYNCKRDLSVLKNSSLPGELVNCWPVLDFSFFREAKRMRDHPLYRYLWLRKYKKEIHPELAKAS